MTAALPDDFELRLPCEERARMLTSLVLRQQLLRLAMKGINATQAARLVRVHPHTAQAVYRDPDFRKEAMRRVDGAFAGVDSAFVESKRSLHERLAMEAENAFEELRGMLAAPETLPSLKAKIAMDFLDRNPETQAGHTVTRLGAALQSEQLAQAARIAREVDGKVVRMPLRGEDKYGT